MRAIDLRDLDFPEVEVECRTSKGTAYTRRLRIGMPKIPREVIDSAFYLYRTVEDAKAGTNPGGTGFVVAWLGSRRNASGTGGFNTYFYGVTNWHVACHRGYSIIRLNRQDGSTDILEYGPEEWEFLPGGVDVAVVPLDIDSTQLHRRTVHQNNFATARQIEHQDIGVGEDVFMIGLFIDHDGLTTNMPSARFGNISLLPNKAAPIEQPTGLKGESYVLDMHSRTGFSGSPVFVYRTFGSDLTTDRHEIEPITVDQGRGGLGSSLRVRGTLFKFLGIHWGQFPEQWELHNKTKIEESRRNHLITEGAYVEGMSGMTCVIPSWEIAKIIDMPKLKKMREDADHVYAGTRSPAPKAEAAESSPAIAANPTHREDFMRLVDAAARKQKQDD